MEKINLKRLGKIALFLVLIATLLVTPIALAFSYQYWTSFTITDTGGSSRTQIPVMVTDLSGNLLLAGGYITSSGLDTALKLGVNDVPYMLASDRLSLVLPQLSSNGTQTLTFLMGYSPARTSFPIVVGSGGNVTIPYAANLEFGEGDWSIDWSGGFTGNTGTLWNQIGNNATSIKVNSSNITATVYAYTLTTYNVTASNFGHVQYYDSGGAAYATVWNAANGTQVANGNDASIGQGLQYLSSNWWIARAYSSFDTSATLNPVYSAYLRFSGYNANPFTAFNVMVKNGMPTYPSVPIVTADYDRTHYSSNGTGGTAAFQTGYFNINLTATGISWINLGGTTNFYFISSDDDAGNGTNEGIGGYNLFGGSNIPRLVFVTKSSLAPIVLNATKPSAGTANITLSRSSNTLGLYVNGVLADSESMVNKLVYDNGENITALDAGVAPYSNYLKVSVGGTEQLWYQPNTMVLGTDLVDRDGGDNDGTINWGTNSNVTISTPTPITSGAIVQTLPATNIQPNSATLNGALIGLGSYSTVSTYFEYGLSTAYTDTTPIIAMNTTGLFAANIGGLVYNTTYHFRAVASAGNVTEYGSDLTFTTTLTGNGGMLQFGGGNAKVFKNYIVTGDMLFTAEIINTYIPYYPIQSPKKYFIIQLISTDNSSILAATPQQDWGDRPIGIYMNPTNAANITDGAGYYIRVQATFASNISTQYQLTPSDWEGYDLTELDNWCIYVAYDMQRYDNQLGYVTVMTDRHLAITDAVGGYFTIGIPGIGTVRPNLFTTSKQNPNFNKGTSANTWDNATAWSTNVGSNIATDAAVLALPFGLSGRDLLAGLVAIGILGIVASGAGMMGGFGALGLFLICIPIVWVATYFKIIGVQYVMILTIIFGLLAIRQLIIKTT